MIRAFFSPLYDSFFFVFISPLLLILDIILYSNVSLVMFLTYLRTFSLLFLAQFLASSMAISTFLKISLHYDLIIWSFLCCFSCSSLVYFFTSISAIPFSPSSCYSSSSYDLDVSLFLGSFKSFLTFFIGLFLLSVYCD